ncbi:nephrin-like isoform X2 [Homarus americanus]|uniref:nephrin-like isoform X2 n=1 Tax=Homarus americanus TaxID=6706 RepID=UPI001C45D64B|nr:nephrin-like isoform X2 [Homarus americanus]
MVNRRPWTHWARIIVVVFSFSLLLLSHLVSPQEIYDEPEPVDEETDPNDEFKNSPVTPAVAVAGKTAVLPCNITTKTDDSVHLVLWYRDHVPTPIYSYDVRSGAYSKPKEWADPELLGERAHFSMTTNPAALVLNQTRRADQAVYRCRVDYKRLTTTHARVNLTVIEPVTSVRIVDESGLELVGAAGPYTVGERPSLTCRVQGGDPLPAVTWWRSGRLLDNTYHQQAPPSSRQGGVVESAPLVVNTIHLRALKKEDLRSMYSCQATNHDLAPTRETAVELDMNFGPESVEVRGLEGPVSAGRPQQVVCEARGSRPPATLTWWLDGSMKKSVSHMTSLDGLVSTSTLELLIGPEEEGSKLTCRAENRDLPATTIEASHQLQVLYPPEVHVAAGPSLDLDHIKEGDDVYFDCIIKARPDAHKISWSFNGLELQQKINVGVMVVGRSLVLQKVTRKQAGSYTCSATNTQGHNTSAPILLSVKYSPVCRVEQTDVYGVGRHEKTTVTCRVEADPPVTAYRWAFNNTGEFVDIPISHFDIKGEGISQRSDLRYSPVSDLDYGTLLCWATNAVGTQRTPCTFTVFPAGKPDVVGSCMVFNETEETVSVSCEPGYSGGVDQSFLIEAWDDGVVRATDTSDTPLLQVTGLRPGTRYTLKVFAVNAMGRSQPYIFTAFTLTDVAERRTALGTGKPGEPLSPIVGSVIGGVSAVVLLLIIALVVAKCKRRNSHEAHSLRESGSTGDVGYKSCGKSDTRQDSGLTDTTETHGHSGPDLVSASQESALMTHSHDSTTPLIGNGRIVQGQGKQEQQLYQPQQQQQSQPQQQSQHYHYPEQHQQKPPQHVVMLDANVGAGDSPYYRDDMLIEGGGVSGGSSGGGSSLPFQPQKVTYVPVYDYHHHPQPQGERDWSMGEDVWSGAPGGTAGVGKEQSDTSPLSPYGVVDPRRHSAYLRPLDQLPPQLTQLPTHLTDHQLARQYVPQPHHPPPSTPKLFQPTSEHESSV